MILNELYDLPKPGYQSEKEDNTPLKLSDLRKTRLTLADLNRLRMANDVRKFEFETKMKEIKDQYGASAEAGAAGGAMPPV